MKTYPLRLRYGILIIVVLFEVIHAIDTLFYQTIPYKEDNTSNAQGNLLSTQDGILSITEQSLSAKSDINFLYDIDPTLKAGVLLTISFTNPPWKTNLSSSVSAICALGINRQPYLKYMGQSYQSQNTIIDKRNYIWKGYQCQFLLNFNKISSYSTDVFSSLFNQIDLAIFNTNSNNSLNYAISIVDFTSGQFTCLNNCSSKGSCNSNTGDCQCQAAWGDADCSQSMTSLNLSSQFTFFTPALSFSALTYFSYAFSSIKNLIFYFYYSLYSADSLKCYFGYEVSTEYKYLPDRWSYDRQVELLTPGANSVYQVQFTKAELTAAFSGVDTSTQSTYRIIIGCYANNSLYSNITDNSPSILTSNSSSRHLAAITTNGKLAIKIYSKSITNDDSTSSNSSFSFVIIASISGGVLFSLLAFAIICTRRRQLMLMRHQNALLALNELHRNHPQLGMNQGALSRRTLNAFTDLAISENVQAEKRYFEDIDKYFPLLTLAQIHNYFRSEVSNMKDDDIDKECAICCCDFLDDPLKQEAPKDEEKQQVSGKSSLPMASNMVKQIIIASQDEKSQQEQQSNQAKSIINGQINSTPSTQENTPQINNNTSKDNAQFKDKANLRLFTICNHFFHASCINDWLKKDKSCPCCRQKLVQAELNTLQGNLEENVMQRTMRLLTSIKRMKSSTISIFSLISRNSFSPGNSQNNTSKNSNKISQQSNLSPQDSPPFLKLSPFLISNGRGPLDNSIILRENQSFYDPSNFTQDQFLEQNRKDNDAGITTNNEEIATKQSASQDTEVGAMTDGQFIIGINGMINSNENNNPSQPSTNNNLDMLNILYINDESPDTFKPQNISPNNNPFFNKSFNSLSLFNNSRKSKNWSNLIPSNFIISGTGFPQGSRLTNAQNTILRQTPANTSNKPAFQKSCNIELKNFS